MPVPRETEVPFRENSKQVGVKTGALGSGSIFKGFQKSKGNSYEVEVVLQVNTVSVDLVDVCSQQEPPVSGFRGNLEHFLLG
jgi:hypothetical protein